MPLLDDAQLKRLRETPPADCPHCGHATVWNYCRQCDEFFYAGHASDCVRMAPGWGSDDHDGHQVY